MTKSEKNSWVAALIKQSLQICYSKQRFTEHATVIFYDLKMALDWVKPDFKNRVIEVS
jgi:hypothetical protein